ncbi:MAG: hypothetical protein GC191_19170 [Azospirillum sp.]|nr:hypothetical protein [Azospirillum sp.]
MIAKTMSAALVVAAVTLPSATGAQAAGSGGRHVSETTTYTETIERYTVGPATPPPVALPEVAARPAQTTVEIIAPSAPPPPRTETIPPPPSGAAGSPVWKPGHWGWTGSDWVWVGGGYVEPEPRYSVWEPGHWIEDGQHWVWSEGHLR